MFISYIQHSYGISSHLVFHPQIHISHIHISCFKYAQLLHLVTKISEPLAPAIFVYWNMVIFVIFVYWNTRFQYIIFVYSNTQIYGESNIGTIGSCNICVLEYGYICYIYVLEYTVSIYNICVFQYTNIWRIKYRNHWLLQV